MIKLLPMGDVTKEKYAIICFFLLPAVPGRYFIGGTRFAHNEAVLCLQAKKPLRNEAVFLPIGKKSLFIPGCVQGAII